MSLIPKQDDLEFRLHAYIASQRAESEQKKKNADPEFMTALAQAMGMTVEELMQPPLPRLQTDGAVLYVGSGSESANVIHAAERITAPKYILSDLEFKDRRTIQYADCAVEITNEDGFAIARRQPIGAIMIDNAVWNGGSNIDGNVLALGFEDIYLDLPDNCIILDHSTFGAYLSTGLYPGLIQMNNRPMDFVKQFASVEDTLKLREYLAKTPAELITLAYACADSGDFNTAHKYAQRARRFNPASNAVEKVNNYITSKTPPSDERETPLDEMLDFFKRDEE